MQTSPTQPGRESHAHITLILAGLALAPLGAGAVALLVLGLTNVYVAIYGKAAIELAGCLVAGGLFFTLYGKYLDRLEQWAPAEKHNVSALVSSRVNQPPVTPDATPDVSGAQPVSTDIVVAVATFGYGLFIAIGGLIWTRGRDLAFNLCAAALFFACAAAVAWFGRRSRRAG